MAGRPVNPASRNSKAGEPILDTDTEEARRNKAIARDQAFCERMRWAIHHGWERGT